MSLSSQFYDFEKEVETNSCLVNNELLITFSLNNPYGIDTDTNVGLHGSHGSHGSGHTSHVSHGHLSGR